jgi:DNA-binding NtrC family response regulator
VRHATGAQAALDALARDPGVDLVFSDMVMPGGMNGMELAREIGRRHPGLPVLLTSGFSPAAAAAEGEGLRVLAKPYTMEALAEAVRAELRDRSAA